MWDLSQGPAAGRIQASTGATLIPPYNYGPVICGQGTIGAEFMDQVPDLDVVIVPISGGGIRHVTAVFLEPTIYFGRVTILFGVHSVW